MNNYGAVIRAKRKHMALSQKQVCHGICAVSHLSKIETGDVELTDEIKSLLMKRLDLSEKEPIREKDCYDLHNFHELIMSMDRFMAFDTYDRLIKRQSLLKFSKYHIAFYLMVYGYYVISKRPFYKKALAAKAYLEDLSNHLNDEQMYSFRLYNGLSELSADRLSGIHLLEDLLKMKSKGYVNFQLMCLNTGMKKYHHALKYAEDAVASFLNEGCMRGIVSTVHYVGTVYVAMGDYDMAETYYKNAIKLSESCQSSDDYIRSYMFFGYSNLGEISMRNNQLADMLKYAELAIEHAESIDKKLYGVLPYFQKAYVLSFKNMDLARKTLNEGYLKLHLSKTQDKALEDVYYSKYDYMIHHRDYIKDEAYKVILLKAESVALNYQLNHMLHEIHDELKLHYTSNRQYKKAMEIG
ncbi:helix-turn-helix transcriptional regulator [Acidaminobacter sp. JC074]|uniref:helix-turn-helix domain-containing protein n=1 Tax=Acidaminobacter sp. JC074 TaxID=2530199 RepID=UPI001F0F8E5F|nr:helix-turn-helix domain-containing protein [Acidaminobacter sp. JC074]MCH4886492.1 helix-turn-helix transcriptional regulator [Acidaminobacter sp. JC074]